MAKHAVLVAYVLTMVVVVVGVMTTGTMPVTFATYHRLLTPFPFISP